MKHSVTLSLTFALVACSQMESLALAEAAPKQPNIVVMMVDDMGFAGPSIAPYGNPHYKTPGMDRLASSLDVGDVHKPARVGAARPGHRKGDAEGLDMQAEAFVAVGHIGQQVRRFEGELVEDFHGKIFKGCRGTYGFAG